MTQTLLRPGDPPPVALDHAGGASPFLILCDHAGRAVPAALGDLGVGTADWDRHIAWDIGAAGVALRAGAALHAATITQAYSRLVIDCNRAPGHPTSIPAVSDGTTIPGNRDLTQAAMEAREREIFRPYHDAIAAELDRRQALGHPSAIIAVHSFTPVFGGVARPWEAGVLHNRQPEFALCVGQALREAGYEVGDNEPYRLADDSDYTVPIHAERRLLPYVELEIRQDLIATEPGQVRWGAVLAEILPQAWKTFR